ncbi:MAG: TAXI family TRAP transporter solute-binding subunit [Devosia sp.]
MMPRRVLLLCLALAVAIGGIAYAAVWLQGTPNTLRVSTGTDGGTYAAFARALKRTIADETPAALEILPSAGANQNARRIGTDEADMGLIQSDTPVAHNTVIVARLFPEVFHLVVRLGAGIETVGDLRGKTVGLMPTGSGSNELFARLLRHYELPLAELTVVNGDLRGHADAITEGSIDAFFMVVALGNNTIEQIIEQAPVQLISIDQAEAMALFDPALRASVVPLGTYSGERPVPAAPIEVVAVDSLLAVRRDLPDSTVEALTRSLFEKRQEMVRILPQAAFVSAPTEQDRLVFGVHPGAELYYSQDDPIFIVEYAEPMALGVTAFALLLSGLWQARIWLSNARKNRADQYNLRIIEILAKVDTVTGAADVERIRRDLFDIFEKVIVDLDNDRIEEKSLVSFSFAWQVAASTLNHRELVLSRGDDIASPAG